MIRSNLVILALSALFSARAFAVSPACSLDPLTLAKALLDAEVAGARVPYGKKECLKAERHPYVAIGGPRQPISGAPGERIHVDEARPYVNLQVAPGDQGSYVATFAWRAPHGEIKADSISFYLDASRMTGSCAAMTKPPEVLTIKKSCDSRQR